MGWESSKRRQMMGNPSGQSIARLARQVIEAAGGRCYVCGLPGADEADHVVPISQGGVHGFENLRAIHAKPCHADKTRRESHTNRTIRRPKEPHPGLRPPPA